jgi:hypothetical protein
MWRVDEDDGDRVWVESRCAGAAKEMVDKGDIEPEQTFRI